MHLHSVISVIATVFAAAAFAAGGHPARGAACGVVKGRNNEAAVNVIKVRSSSSFPRHYSF